VRVRAHLGVHGHVCECTYVYERARVGINMFVRVCVCM